MMVTQHPTPLPQATAHRVVGDSSCDNVGGTRWQDNVIGQTMGDHNTDGGLMTNKLVAVHQG